MHTITTCKEASETILSLKRNGKTVGFVPTLGALHEGHLTLMRQAQKENDILICSIFVNPTQFNEKEDLDKYPRTMEADVEKLLSIDCDYLFAPSVEEMYPSENEVFDFSFGGLEMEMEGAFRPGHFQGVGQIVKKLLDAVQPTRLYMGQKDFQQFTLIQYMIDTMDLPVELCVVPIIREEDGLAMSSRNRRLSEENRKRSPLIYKTLIDFLALKDLLSVDELIAIAMARFEALDGFKPEYFTVADGRTLKPIDDLSTTDYAVVCCAVWAGDIRLIDNLILKHPTDG